MRTIPGLTGDVLARATQLAAKAKDARSAVPAAVQTPRASIAPAKVDGDTAVLRLYDYIDPDGGYWGISASEFAEALDAAGEVQQIELRINSGGGSVWDGLAMLNTLRDHTASVRAVVDGVAASAASFIAVACDELVMMPNSKMMIHDAYGLCIGQPGDMREYAAFLDDTSDNIAEIYATKTSGEVADWRATMTAGGLNGQWYSAQQAVDVGLADSVGGQVDDEQNRVAAGVPVPSSAQAAAPEQPAPPVREVIEHKASVADRYTRFADRSQRR